MRRTAQDPCVDERIWCENRPCFPSCGFEGKLWETGVGGMRCEGAVVSFSKGGMHGSDYEVGGGGCILYLLAGPAEGRDG